MTVRRSELDVLVVNVIAKTCSSKKCKHYASIVVVGYQKLLRGLIISRSGPLWSLLRITIWHTRFHRSATFTQSSLFRKS